MEIPRHTEGAGGGAETERRKGRKGKIKRAHLFKENKLKTEFPNWKKVCE